MVTITPDSAGNLIVFSLIGYVFTLAYSIYMAILNHKQSKVKDLIERTNCLLEDIYNEVKK